MIFPTLLLVGNFSLSARNPKEMKEQLKHTNPNQLAIPADIMMDVLSLSPDQTSKVQAANLKYAKKSTSI